MPHHHAMASMIMDFFPPVIHSFELNNNNMDMDGKVVRTYTEIPFWYKNDVQGGNDDDHDHDHHYDGYLRRKGERKKERKN